MACFSPLHGYRGRSVNASGKVPIVFNAADGYADLPVTLPCGRCDGCKLDRSRQWAVRCVHEASLYERNCFITLTVSDEFVTPSLVKHRGKCDCEGKLCRSFAAFMKRLRRRFPDERIRFYHAGEYGEKYGRPHYHACLFNFDFADKISFGKRNGFPIWRSPDLETLWPFGNSEIGTVTFESAAYVARYIMKKVTGPLAQGWYLELDEDSGEVTSVLPEYTTMSRRPGIGAEWYARYGKEVFPADSVVSRGRLVKPPRYYFGKYELQDALGAVEVARERRRSRRLEDETPERLLVREQVTRARLALSKREVE